MHFVCAPTQTAPQTSTATTNAGVTPPASSPDLARVLTVLANLHAVSLGALPTGAEATAQKQTAARRQKQTAARRLWHRRRCARTHHGHHPSQHGHANKHGHASKIDGHQDGHRILGHKGRVRAHETTSLFIFARALDDGAQEYQTTFRRCDGTAKTPQ